MSRQTRSSTKAALALTHRPTSPPSLPTPTPARPSMKSRTKPQLTSAQQTSSSAKTTQDLETHLFPTPLFFQTYLATHHLSSPGLWLQIAKVSSQVPSITYDQALDIALCHGWIDGQRKTLSSTHFIQKFTPRRKGSLWSKRNVDKAVVLMEEGKMTEAGMAQIDAAKADGRWERAYVGSKEMVEPADWREALEGNPAALRVWDGLGKGKRYGFLMRIETAKRAETRSRRIEGFVGTLAEGRTV